MKNLLLILLLSPLYLISQIQYGDSIELYKPFFKPVDDCIQVYHLQDTLSNQRLDVYIQFDCMGDRTESALKHSLKIIRYSVTELPHERSFERAKIEEYEMEAIHTTFGNEKTPYFLEAQLKNGGYIKIKDLIEIKLLKQTRFYRFPYFQK